MTKRTIRKTTDKSKETKLEQGQLRTKKDKCGTCQSWEMKLREKRNWELANTSKGNLENDKSDKNCNMETDNIENETNY